jgi:geranylgeranyl diphosphate synthase, type II
MYAGAPGEHVEALRAYGEAIGLAFQIVDDILDVTQTSEQLGKTAGKDVASEKATYPALFGIEKSRQKAASLLEASSKALERFQLRGDALRALAKFLIEREN